MGRTLPVFILFITLNAAVLPAETVMVLAQSPENPSGGPKVSAEIREVKAYIENGIAKILFDNGHISFIDSVEEESLTDHWDQAKLIEVRGKTKAEYLVAVKVLPRGKDSSQVRVLYQILGTGGLSRQGGTLELESVAGSPWEEVGLKAGEDIAGELLQRIMQGGGKG